MHPRRIFLSRYLYRPRPYRLPRPPSPPVEPRAPSQPDAHAQPIYCDAPKQHCTSLSCSHSKWTIDHPEFVAYRRLQASSRTASLPERIRGKVAGLICFEGFWKPLVGNRFKQVAPSGYNKLPEKYGAEVFDNMLCLCALDPSISACAARARVINRTADGEGWVLACHRVPTVTEGRLDYTNTCGMFVRIHSYYPGLDAVSAEDVPQFGILLGSPIPPRTRGRKSEAAAAPVAARASGSKRRHSIAAAPSASGRSSSPAVIDLTGDVIDLTGDDD